MAPAEQPSDVTAYLIIEDFGELGRVSRDRRLRSRPRDHNLQLISGKSRNALQVVAFNTAEGWPHDVRAARFPRHAIRPIVGRLRALRSRRLGPIGLTRSSTTAIGCKSDADVVRLFTGTPMT